MEEDREWGGISGENDQLGGTTIEGLGRFVGALFELAVMAGLLDGVEDLLGEGFVGDWPCGAGIVGHGCLDLVEESDVSDAK